MKNFLLATILLAVCQVAVCQNASLESVDLAFKPESFKKGSESIRRFGLQFGLDLHLGRGEYEAYKLQADYLFTPKLSAEVGTFIQSEGDLKLIGINVGAKYFFVPMNEKGIHPYCGLGVGTLEERFYGQIPFGIKFLAKNGFQADLGLVPYTNPNSLGSGVFAELALGWRF